jgi:TolA-binding protein
MQGEGQESATTTTASPSAELDAEFQRAKTLLNEDKFDEASDIFSSLLASRYPSSAIRFK